MSTPTNIVEGFSISHAAILDGSTGADAVGGDVYGVREGTLEPDTDSYDNTGDDAVLSSWFWFNYCTITITAGYISYPMVALLTGDTQTSSGSGSTTSYSLPLWSAASLNVAPRPMIIKVPSKDSNGLIRTLSFVIYKVQFNPITFQGPTYKDGLVVSYTGRGLLSDKDEKGVALAGGGKAIGRMISSQ